MIEHLIRKTISSNNPKKFIELLNEYLKRGYVPIHDVEEVPINEQIHRENNYSSIELKVDEYFHYMSMCDDDPMEIFKVGNMIDGKKHGEWLITFPDTKRLLLKEEYNNGIKEGNWKEYVGNDEKNWKIEEGEYSNNKKVGCWTEYFKNNNIHIQRHYEKGIPYSISIYYENGQLKQEGYFRDSVIKYGKWVSYEEDGTLFSENYYNIKNGNLIDTRILDNGILISIEKDDLKPKNGFHIEDYKYSKDSLYEGNYKNGLKVGKWKCYKEPVVLDGGIKLESDTIEHEYENGKITKSYGMMYATQNDNKIRQEWDENIVTQNIKKSKTVKSYSKKQFIKKMEDFENLINGLI
jgi:antitoxin component YwqK of YwqJK toxin-antitoxin module